MRLCYAVKQKKINQNSMLSIIIVAIIYHAVICIENCQCIEYDDWEQVYLLLQKYADYFSAIFLLGNQHCCKSKNDIGKLCAFSRIA